MIPRFARISIEVVIAVAQWFFLRDAGVHVPLIACLAYMLIFGELGWRWINRRVPR